MPSSCVLRRKNNTTKKPFCQGFIAFLGYFWYYYWTMEKEEKKKDCYLCTFFKNVFIFTFGLIVGLVFGILL